MKKEPIRFDVASQTYANLLKLVSVGLWGETADDVALQLMFRGLQEAAKSGFLTSIGAVKQSAVEHDSGPAGDVRADWRWCEQCERRVSPAKAMTCASRFCKAKFAA